MGDPAGPTPDHGAIPSPAQDAGLSDSRSGYPLTAPAEPNRAGHLRFGSPDRTPAPVTRFTVQRGGTPVTDLEPHLGAYAHLVALRANDLAYLHVHPQGEIGRTPADPESSSIHMPRVRAHIGCI
ncbi:hypothetical protein [Nocardia sp. NBC_00565]|uniref:hypothetical protein n=1 Tax=Nocardia sp. NBC_00565 TaxID=2975993 RepID=UPI003FA5B93C